MELLSTIIPAVLTIAALTYVIIHKIRSDRVANSATKEWEDTLADFIKRNKL